MQNIPKKKRGGGNTNVSFFITFEQSDIIITNPCYLGYLKSMATITYSMFIDLNFKFFLVTIHFKVYHDDRGGNRNANDETQIQLSSLLKTYKTKKNN